MKYDHRQETDLNRNASIPLGETKAERVEEDASAHLVSTGEIQTRSQNQEQKVKSSLSPSPSRCSLPRRFRRLARKDRQKQEEKDLQKLATEHPDQFLERLNQLERRRVEERSTLRHKNSTKWAKEKRLLAKFNEKVRDDIEEQLKLGKQLSTKQAAADSDDDEDEDIVDEPKKVVVDTTKTKPIEIPLILAPSQQEAEANPWLTSTGSVVLPASEYSKADGSSQQ